MFMNIIICIYCKTLLTFKQDENLHQNVTTNGGCFCTDTKAYLFVGLLLFRVYAKCSFHSSLK